MPFPVIFFFVPDGRSNSSLRRAGMGTRGQDLGDHSDINPICTFNRCSKPSQPSSYNDNIVLEIHDNRLSTFPTQKNGSLKLDQRFCGDSIR
jgi:hypothetical protein